MGTSGDRVSGDIPARKLIAVTKADSDLPNGVCRGLWVGTAGTANIQDASGTTRTSVPLLAGLFPFPCLQVRTGGTAADIWAIY